MTKKRNNYKSYSNVSIDELHKINLLSIKSQAQLNEYIHKTGEILAEYYKGENKEELKHQYLMLTDINYRIKHSKVDFNIYCDKCNISRLYIPEESRYVCTTCGETEYILTQLADYSDKPYFQKYIPYNRITYLKETLNRLQSKETKFVPEPITEFIKNELFKAKVKVDKCTTKQILWILNKSKLQKYYPNIQQIYCTITGCQPITISHQTEQQIIYMFKQIEQVYDKLYPNNSKFLNYSYVLNKLFHMINMPHIANCFFLLKDKNKLIRHDEVFCEICKLNWNFI
jgi:hypothetical protein